ncbi:MAG: hypothetical protein Fur009_0660 [Candidatus Microgenomates bacterium]
MTVFAQSITTSWDSCMVDGVPTLGCLEIVFGNLLSMSTAFIVLILFIMFVYGAFQYLTSFGNAEKVKKAQGTIRYALIGFILFISAYLILNIIDILFLGGQGNIFKFNLTNP